MGIWEEENTLNKKLEESTLVKIDKMYFDTKIGFDVIKDFLLQKYKIFNKRYFDGKLRDLTKDDFHIVYESAYCGNALYSAVFDIELNKITSIIFDGIEISKYTKLSEKEWCDVLLHEMIHMKQVDILHQKSNHDVSFINEMNRLNSFGWHIEIKLTGLSYRKIYKDFFGTFDIKSNILLAILNNNGDFKVVITHVKNLDFIKNNISNFLILSLNNTDLLSKVPYSYNLKNNYFKNGVEYINMTKDELLDLIQNKDLSKFEESKTLQESEEDKIINNFIKEYTKDADNIIISNAKLEDNKIYFDMRII